MTDILAPGAEQHRQSETIVPHERVRLGGDEFAICGAIDLAPTASDDRAVRMVLLDVGFRNDGTGYGPYDIDGSGIKRTFEKPYVLVRRQPSEQGPVTLTHEFEDGDTVRLGRASWTARVLGYDDDTQVSKHHAKLTVKSNGAVSVRDEGSLNGTQLRSAHELLGDVNTNYRYTFSISDFVHQAGRGNGYSPKDEAAGWGYGEFDGRPIIARDTPVNGGVYPVGGTHGEAIVVDDKKYPEELDDVYEEVLSSLNAVAPEKTGVRGLRKWIRKTTPLQARSEQDILENVFDVVSKNLKYDFAATNALAKDYEKIALNSYINHKVGVCRTQAILVAYIAERLIADGKLEGRISIDRNDDHVVAGGHAWARYTAPDGRVYIIDPAQRYVGTLENTYNAKNKWDYRRSEDMVSQLLSG